MIVTAYPGLTFFVPVLWLCKRSSISSVLSRSSGSGCEVAADDLGCNTAADILGDDWLGSGPEKAVAEKVVAAWCGGFGAELGFGWLSSGVEKAVVAWRAGLRAGLLAGLSVGAG